MMHAHREGSARCSMSTADRRPLFDQDCVVVGRVISQQGAARRDAEQAGDHGFTGRGGVEVDARTVTHSPGR